MLPGGHPHAPRRQRFPRLRRRAPLSHRHYDALTARIDRLDHERKEDVDRLFTRLGFVEDTLAVVRDQPDAIMLGRIADELRQIREEAVRHHLARRRWQAFLEDFAESASSAATSAMDASADLQDFDGNEGPASPGPVQP